MSPFRNFGRILRPQAVISQGTSFFPRLLGLSSPFVSSSSFLQQQQQSRGIRVKVINGNLEQALQVMQRKIVNSGMERLIRRAPTHHMKNSEKRILAEKNLQKRIKSEDLARKLKTILIKKIRFDIKPVSGPKIAVVKIVCKAFQEISQLRYALCPRHMKERQFWHIYFKLVKNHVQQYELLAARDSRLKSLELEDSGSSRTAKQLKLK